MRAIKTGTEAFTIDMDRFEMVERSVQEQVPTITTGWIRAQLFADWSEGDEHQKWLDNAKIQEIADWCVDCYRGQDHDEENDEDA